MHWQERKWKLDSITQSEIRSGKNAFKAILFFAILGGIFWTIVISMFIF